VKRIGVSIAIVLMAGFTVLIQAAPKNGWLALFKGEGSDWLQKESATRSGSSKRARSYARVPQTSTAI
jgi:hypothetical protein